jgi:hypothetical protein
VQSNKKFVAMTSHFVDFAVTVGVAFFERNARQCDLRIRQEAGIREAAQLTTFSKWRMAMLFGELGLTSTKLAEEFVSSVLRKMRRIDTDVKPPCSGGSRPIWNGVVKEVLRELGNKHGYDQAYPWLVDFIWWSNRPQRLGLVVESELDKLIGKIEEDFQKLSAFKCPLKLMVFSADPEDTKSMAERNLQVLTQHIKDEEYLLIGFTASGPRCFLFRVPTDGSLEHVNFSELQLSKAVVAEN